MTSDSGRQAGAHQGGEIGVTPEMIEAGIEAFGGYQEGWDPLGPVIEAVFLAMMRAGRETGTPNIPSAFRAP